METIFRHRPKIIRVTACMLLTTAALATGLMLLKYRAWENGSRLAYTTAIKRIDIRDTAQRAFYALIEAAWNQESYVLTGEVRYSEAFAGDLRTWNDELGTLQIISAKDNAKSLIETLGESGKRAAGEMETIRSIYEKAGREPALDRIRKGGADVFIAQAREGFAQIELLYGTATYVEGVEGILQRLLQAALLLSALALTLGVLLILATRSHNTVAAQKLSGAFSEERTRVNTWT